MAIDFHYGGLPPAMARKFQVPGGGIPQEAQAAAESMPRMSDMGGLPQMPQQAMPQMPQMQQMQMPQMSQFMPQGMPQMPDMQQFMPGNMQNQMQQYMPNGQSGMQNNNDFFNNLMSQMKNQKSQSQPYSAPQGNNMGMGKQGMEGEKVAPSKGAKGLGALSARHESNGSPGAIGRNKGDLGGASYGAYQLSTNSGNAQKFASQYGGSLKGLKAGSAAFDKAWKAEASRNPKGFAAAQHNYIKQTHFDPGASNVKKRSGIDVTKRSKALQDVVWSASVQHGTGGVGSLFRNAGVTDKMSDEQIIRKVYAERRNVGKYFSGSPKNIQASVRNRFVQEEKEALAMLRG